MIHYHGLPITPDVAARAAIAGGHAFISFRRMDQIGLVLDVCQSFAIDNGAFSAWRAGSPVENWFPFYEEIDRIMMVPSFDFAVIPDVIGGTEKENDRLIDEWPWKGDRKRFGIGAPVWHMHESIARLRRLVSEWPRVCIGSSGQYAVVGSARWWRRIGESLNAICDDQGRPFAKLHGLRMLNPEIFSNIPFSSADSTNIAQNIGINSAWKGTYTPVSKSTRAIVMRERIESHQSPTRWHKFPTQAEMVLDEHMDKN